MGPGLGTPRESFRPKDLRPRKGQHCKKISLGGPKRSQKIEKRGYLGDQKSG